MLDQGDPDCLQNIKFRAFRQARLHRILADRANEIMKVDGVFAMAQVLGGAVTPNGEVVAEPRRVLLLRRDGRTEEVSGGWDHLARDPEPRAGDGGGVARSPGSRV